MGETMANDVEKEWAGRAKRFSRLKLKRAEISYAELGQAGSMQRAFQGNRGVHYK